MEGCEGVVELHDVLFDFVKFGVGHLVGKIAVVGEEDETRGVFDEATDGFERLVFCW